MTIKWADSKPAKRKGAKRATVNASFATVGSNKLTAYATGKAVRGVQQYHAAINGKRIDGAYKSIDEAKAALAEQVKEA